MKTKLFLLLVLSVNAFGETLPPDAAALKAKRDAKIAEINQLYATALEKLMKKAMAEGNLDTAKLLEDEMNEAAPDPFVEKTAVAAKVTDSANPIVGKWKWGESLVAEFTPDGRATAKGYSGVWVEKESSSLERKYTVSWNDGIVIDYLIILQDGEKARAKNSNDQKFVASKINPIE